MHENSTRGGRSYTIAKRTLDLVVAAGLLLLLSPAIAVITLVIALTMGRPVLFRQVRPGRAERPFTILKFRTMTNARDAAGRLLGDGERLTRVGRALRRLSLDEVPELLNVLIGDMSLVGPRPLLVRYLDRYSPRQRRRHEVLPGLTGWAQVNGRNALTWKEKLELDVWYVEHRSFSLDLRILGRTIKILATRQGINQPGSATAEEFLGE